MNNGTADISTVHTVRLSRKEEASITMDEKEYAENAWVEADDIVGNKHKYHPALRQAVCDLLAFRKWAELGQLVNGAGSSSSDNNRQVAECARGLVALHHSAEANNAGKIEVQRMLIFWTAYQSPKQLCVHFRYALILDGDNTGISMESQLSSHSPLLPPTPIMAPVHLHLAF